MNKVVRWTPIRNANLLEEFDRLFDAPLSNTRTVWNASRNWGLAVDVVENEDAFTVKASVPGISADDLDLTFEDNTLVIKGEMAADEEKEGETFHIRERRTGSFSRRVRFPVEVNGDAIAANYENGVLVLTLPKAEEVKPKRIEVKIG